MKKIKIEITKAHPSGLKKGVVKRVTSPVAVQLMVSGYAEQVEEEGVDKIDIKQLHKNRAGTSDKAKKLGTLRIGVLASVGKYNKLERQAQVDQVHSEASPEDEKMKEKAEDSATASKKAFDYMKKLSSKYEGFIKEVKNDSIKIPEAPKKTVKEDGPGSNKVEKKVVTTKSVTIGK